MADSPRVDRSVNCRASRPAPSRRPKGGAGAPPGSPSGTLETSRAFVDCGAAANAGASSAAARKSRRVTGAAELLGASARPHRTLVFALRHAVHPLVEEALQPPAVIGLGRVEVALRVGGDAVNGVELSRHLAAVAEAGEDFERLAIEDPDLLVVPVGEVDELLLW